MVIDCIKLVVAEVINQVKIDILDEHNKIHKIHKIVDIMQYISPELKLPRVDIDMVPFIFTPYIIEILKRFITDTHINTITIYLYINQLYIYINSLDQFIKYNTIKQNSSIDHTNAESIIHCVNYIYNQMRLLKQSMIIYTTSDNEVTKYGQQYINISAVLPKLNRQIQSGIQMLDLFIMVFEMEYGMPIKNLEQIALEMGL